MYKYGFIDRSSYILALEEHLDLVEKNIRYEIQADYVAEMVRKVYTMNMATVSIPVV